MNLTPYQVKIMKALAELPLPATVKAVAEHVGQEVTAKEIRLLVAVELVGELDVSQAPRYRYTLTQKGKAWVKQHLPNVVAAEVSQPAAPPTQTVASEHTTPRGRRMNDETRAWLWSRFAAGEGATRESAKALGEQIGFHYTSVRYQHQMWEKAGRPGTAPPPARADALPFEVEGQLAPIEHPSPDLQQAVQVEMFDAGAAGQQIVQSAPEVHNGEADLIGERSEMVEVSVPTIELAPAAAVPSTSMAAALMKAGLELPSTQEEPETERLPEVGQVYEGAVYAVDQGGMFAIVELVEFSDPGARRWLRGKVSRSQVLRRGWCDDVRDWLKPGDLVNVRVMEISPGRNRQGWKISLSIKHAPAHLHERIRLEAEEQRLRPEELPIVATGAQVAAAIEAERAMPTQESVAPDPNPQLMARVAELEELLARKDEQVATQSETIGNLWSSMKALQASEARLTAGRDELVDTVLKVTREAEQLRREARGICASCVHGLDKFCPYAEALVTPEFEVPTEELPERHQDARIVFGRRPVVECSLYRPESKVG